MNWGTEYDIRRPKYDKLRSEIEYALENALPPDRIKISYFVSRVKDKNSFVEKIRRKKYDFPFEEMIDIVGARVVCLFLDDLPRIDSIIREAFDVVLVEDKMLAADPDIMRYRSVHYDCTIRSDHSGTRYDDIKDIKFEVQCRTVSQDAWAAVEHELGYKNFQSIPDPLKRDIAALVGLFHVADRTFQQLRDDIEKSERQAVEKVDSVGDLQVVAGLSAEVDVVIDRGMLKALLRRLYPLRKEGSNSSYSELVQELSDAGITGIGQLTKILLENGPSAEADERENPPYDAAYGLGTDMRTTYSDAGLVRNTLNLAVPEFELRLVSQEKWEERGGA